MGKLAREHSAKAPAEQNGLGIVIFAHLEKALFERFHTLLCRPAVKAELPFLRLVPRPLDLLRKISHRARCRDEAGQHEDDLRLTGLLNVRSAKQPARDRR